MKKQLLLSVLILALSLSFAAPAFSQEKVLTPDNPLKVDMKERTVSILASFNGKHPEPTHHGVVFKGGKLYHKAFFVGLACNGLIHHLSASSRLSPFHLLVICARDVPSAYH